MHTSSPLQAIQHPLFTKHNLNVQIKRDDLIHPIISGNRRRTGGETEFLLFCALTRSCFADQRLIGKKHKLTAPISVQAKGHSLVPKMSIINGNDAPAKKIASPPPDPKRTAIANAE